ncbi:MAG: hypothetical protein Q4D21_10550 [Phascolarctobacterium sp.]|nr:hypothetical protein [Phascolarctobacterium sp.]
MSLYLKAMIFFVSAYFADIFGGILLQCWVQGIGLLLISLTWDKNEKPFLPEDLGKMIGITGSFYILAGIYRLSI